MQEPICRSVVGGAGANGQVTGTSDALHDRHGGRTRVEGAQGRSSVERDGSVVGDDAVIDLHAKRADAVAGRARADAGQGQVFVQSKVCRGES